ncbi:hypothetical protein GZ77_10260 [Endozoicomonas montiporae]|uniref:PPM-type phosphatase domain-containing protein n=2 Tax=Endozoicomonas montiporae TaxID=1027273 RepID=A0A081N8B4_9GAMM|nr:PP2C family protein-serine/threonine phosphatase [Endozoicomonas montiporae]AMO55424.1 hypothetical protein EZMO1_1231 [Endozoicomonas montiporae CL-33]KEQ14687.1 hypothetical protein GZ77_10260 [Endozoicomonas montiporae]
MNPSELNAYPTAYDFCKTIREYGKSKPGEQLGMSDNGRVMSEKEFNQEFGQTDGTWGWTKSWVVTVKDPQGKTFTDYQNNMTASLNTYAERTHLSERGIQVQAISSLTPSGLKPFVGDIEKSAKTPFLPKARVYDRIDNQKNAVLPNLREGDYKHLMSHLKQAFSGKFDSDFESEAKERAFFQELCSINSKFVEELAIRVSSSYRDNKEESDISDHLAMELSARRRTLMNRPLSARLNNLPDKEQLVKSTMVNGRTVDTIKKQCAFVSEPKLNKLSLQELQDLDYEITTNAAMLKEELAVNKKRAREQGENEAFDEKQHGTFQRLLDGTQPLGRWEYADHYKIMSKELPATGIAAADGNVVYGMEDVTVAQQAHGIIAGHWTPVRITAVLDGHTVDCQQDKGDNSAATESARKLPKALIERLSSMNKRELTTTGMVGACQAAIVDLDRQGDYKLGGSTINAAAVIGQHLCIINTGDSRSLFVNPAKAPSEAGAYIQLSEDAELLPEDNPDNRESRFNKMVHERGGLITLHPSRPSQIRVKSIDTPEGEPGMSCVSSIGDHHYNSVTSPKPFVTVYDQDELDSNGFLIQFSDGIPEVATNEQITRLVHKLCAENPDITPDNLAASIRDHAFRARSGDNLSVIVTRVKDLL